jgi:hypothetical protein
MSLALLHGELKANFEDFTKQWQEELEAVAKKHAAHDKIFEASYVRVALVQSWRTVVEGRMDDDCAAFFFEAQNDLLVSHCLARCGSFRQALKALRGCIENVLNALYYMDHPIEMKKWLVGEHRLGFTDLYTYFVGHPAVEQAALEKSGLPDINNQYAILSRAVHASAKQFRMTTDLTDTKLWVNDPIAVNKWASNERIVVNALSLLLLSLFANELEGAKNLQLRSMLSLTIPGKNHAGIKKRFGVTLPS